jgi:magnesium chelatase family protein
MWILRRFTPSLHLPPGMITRYRSKVSGPLMDRIDIHIDVPAVPYKELSNEYVGEKSESIRNRASEARSRQLQRFSNDKIFANGQMKTRHMKKHCTLTSDAQAFSTSPCSGSA